MAKKFKCKNPDCPSKGKAQNSILVISECVQTLSLPNDDWTDLEVMQEPLYGQCKECAARIPKEILDELIEKAGS